MGFKRVSPVGGFGDVRPAHGFAFAWISEGDATTAHVAEHLGITKQAAGQLVEYLVDHGCCMRRPDKRDGRARSCSYSLNGSGLHRGGGSFRRGYGRWMEISVGFTRVRPTPRGPHDHHHSRTTETLVVILSPKPIPLWGR